MSAKHYFYGRGACYMNVLGEMVMDSAHGEFHSWGNAEDKYACLPHFLFSNSGDAPFSAPPCHEVFPPNDQHSPLVALVTCQAVGVMYQRSTHVP